MKHINIVPLSEGVFTIGHDKQFVPFKPDQHELKDRPIGSLLVEIQPFLVQVDGMKILFDAGLGYSLSDGQLQIHQNLSNHGINANDIDMVILSHLHKDHAGGVSFENEQGVRSLSFPNAKYCISRQEFDYALSKGLPSYVLQDFELLKNSNQTEWLDEEGTIYPNIQYRTVGGHCPFHQTFLIKRAHGSVFYAGDVAPQLKQLKTKYIAKYDFDGRRSMELRQEFAVQGHEEQWTFLFYHDVNMPISIL